jgi:hypothetical protein
MAHHLQAPFGAGVKGVILWGRADTQKRTNKLNKYFHKTMVPLLPPYLDRYGETCYPDLDSSGMLDLFDFLAFTNLFNAGDLGADFDGDGVLNLFDFLAFTNAFNAGC